MNNLNENNYFVMNSSKSVQMEHFPNGRKFSSRAEQSSIQDSSNRQPSKPNVLSDNLKKLLTPVPLQGNFFSETQKPKSSHTQNLRQITEVQDWAG